MPIKSCTLEGGGKGFKWGGHGKCYKNRADAVRQAQAAYSNGWKGHSKSEEIPTLNDMISLLISDIDENDPLFYEICRDLNLCVSDIYIILERKKEDKKNKKKTKYPDPSDEDEDDEDEDVNDDDEEDED